MLGLEFSWPSRFHHGEHLSTRQYARILREWVMSIGLKPNAYGTHWIRRTKVAEIFKKTGNFRAVQLLLGHTKMDSTVRCFGVELDDDGAYQMPGARSPPVQGHIPALMSRCARPQIQTSRDV